jgi:hypothetical protein
LLHSANLTSERQNANQIDDNQIKLALASLVESICKASEVLRDPNSVVVISNQIEAANKKQRNEQQRSINALDKIFVPENDVNLENNDLQNQIIQNQQNQHLMSFISPNVQQALQAQEKFLIDSGKLKDIVNHYHYNYTNAYNFIKDHGNLFKKLELDIEYSQSDQNTLINYCPNLEILSFKYITPYFITKNQKIPCSNNLKELHLNNCSLGYKHMENFKLQFQNFSKLEILDLSNKDENQKRFNNCYRLEGIEIIITGVSLLPHLRELDFSGVHFYRTFLERLHKQVRKINPRIKILGSDLTPPIATQEEPATVSIANQTQTTMQKPPRKKSNQNTFQYPIIIDMRTKVTQNTVQLSQNNQPNQTIITAGIPSYIITAGIPSYIEPNQMQIATEIPPIIQSNQMQITDQLPHVNLQNQTQTTDQLPQNNLQNQMQITDQLPQNNLPNQTEDTGNQLEYPPMVDNQEMVDIFGNPIELMEF